MADNYLEKQYEQYEAKKAAWEKTRKYGQKSVRTTQQPQPIQPKPSESIAPEAEKK